MTRHAVRQGIVLFGHGSRDPAWAAPFEAVRARIAADVPEAAVRCAYLELTAPSLPAAVADLAASGVGRLRIVPLFLGMGRHAREDLPALVDGLRAAHPGLAIEVAPAVGEDPRVIALLAEVARGGPPSP
ncbi:sirohydrochlorin chelatase [Xylophilus sp.]|uniref:sirohydrochlorin chelatase n=1 Tax=Xylophilus sp. TaxID=2653893 RepID=UPI0013B9DDC9|nr:CbiX/SirB N-terminal domain-containing protein [Xylophilus sp.]KAF1049592.1 MAG: Sirohydrochlorin ferrochelatase [Xylophilus sp.]